jgi:hypothetical protein
MIGFNFLWIRNNIFFYGARSSALHPTPILGDQVTVQYMSPSDRVSQLYAQALAFIFVVFYDLRD